MIREFCMKYKSKINIWYLLFSAMFSAMLIVSGHIFYDPNNNSTVETAFVSDFHIVDMIGIFLLIPLIYIVMKMVEFCFGAATTIFYGEKRKKNIPYNLRFSVVVPFVLLVAVLILRILNYEEPVTNMIDDRVLAYFSNSQANVRAALIEFTNTVNKIVEVVKFVAFTLIIVKIVDFFPKKAIVQNESNNEISL